MTGTPQGLAATPGLGEGWDDVAGSDGPRGMLTTTLEQIRLAGAIFFRAEFTDQFAFESAPLAFAGALTPHADRLILFHIVAAGECWVAMDDGIQHWASDGDVIVMPYGGRYVLGGRTPAEPVTLA